ncbi:MAG: IS4/IS5 family transposase [Hymenobacter sp.]|nr:MAG: IS4/IS5 family transposase [Hymenobacter sp.]
MARSAGPAAGAYGGHCGLAVGTDWGKKGGCHGYDAGKQVAGRKRHIAVDTEGFLLVVHVQAGDEQERLGARAVFATLGQQVPTVRLVWVDGGYSGPLVQSYGQAIDCQVNVVAKPVNQKGFAVLPRRWVVERTFGWLGKYRRLAGRDYETTVASSEAWIRICMSHLMLRRLARKRKSET